MNLTLVAPSSRGSPNPSHLRKAVPTQFLDVECLSLDFDLKTVLPFCSSSALTIYPASAHLVGLHAAYIKMNIVTREKEVMGFRNI